MPRIRPTAVAGQFYSRNPRELDRQISQYLRQAVWQDASEKTRGDSLQALIAPHAGYLYSGSIAGSAYARIQNPNRFQRVILLGPSHRYPLYGVALPDADELECPLGNLIIDKQACEKLLKHKSVQILDRAHQLEHSLEVHFPFIKKTLPQAQIVPLACGQIEPENLAQILEGFLSDQSTLIIISTDLSHFQDYQSAQIHDQKTSQHILNRDYRSIQPEDACGCYGLNGLLYLADQKNLEVVTIDVRNSGDTAGSPDKVVGYGAWGMYVN